MPRPDCSVDLGQRIVGVGGELDLLADQQGPLVRGAGCRYRWIRGQGRQPDPDPRGVPVASVLVPSHVAGQNAFSDRTPVTSIHPKGVQRALGLRHEVRFGAGCLEELPLGSIHARSTHQVPEVVRRSCRQCLSDQLVTPTDPAVGLACREPKMPSKRPDAPADATQPARVDPEPGIRYRQVAGGLASGSHQRQPCSYFREAQTVEQDSKFRAVTTSFRDRFTSDIVEEKLAKHLHVLGRDRPGRGYLGSAHVSQCAERADRGARSDGALSRTVPRLAGRASPGLLSLPT